MRTSKRCRGDSATSSAGLHWGSAFFGWLVAVGIATLLTAILSAAGAAVGLTQEASTQDATTNADTIGIAGGIVLLAILILAYYAGGYVAGRMARFSGPRQGLGVWIIALVVTVVLAVAGAVLGDGIQRPQPAQPSADPDR